MPSAKKDENIRELVFPHKIGDNILLTGYREHLKASEAYVDVIFKYPDSNEEWKGSVPIEYKRTGVHAETVAEVEAIVKQAYDAMDPKKREAWLKEQEEFWNKNLPRAKVTRAFFEALKDSKWKCRNCDLPPNPNWARRIQDIKDLGYTIATNTKMYCKKCGQKTTHVILLRLPRGGKGGYEMLSPSLRKRILEVLEYYDAYEDRKHKHLIPDHKFPEIRWDKETREEYLREMSDEEIREKFQLLTNQRNEQKREVCRNCFQTGRRGTPFGIKFFYKGDEKWPEGVPKIGKAAEEGCVGCGWYDLARWRQELNKLLSKVKRLRESNLL